MSSAADQHGVFSERRGLMDMIRQTILSVTAAAMLCGILSELLSNHRTKNLIRFLFGLFLTIAVVGQFSDLDTSQFQEIPFIFADMAQEAVSSGEHMANSARADIIKRETEAYILDKAAQLNADISAEILVSTDDPPVPVAASIYGEMTPYIRAQLQYILDRELGISKEHQQWNGER